MKKGAFCLFFFICLQLHAQEINWKGSQLQSGTHKIIDGEISIKTGSDVISAQKAIIYKVPKKAVLQGNVALQKDGSTVTGDSGIYFPDSKQARVAGNAVIRTRDGDIYSESFLYHLNDRMLYSEYPLKGQAKDIRFSAERGLIFPNSGNIRLTGNAVWENDSAKGMADTIILDKTSQLVKMHRNARIQFKNKADELAGKYIEIDLKANKISKIVGSEIRQQNMKIKAASINREGDNYDLRGNVRLSSADSMLFASGEQAFMGKDRMQMQGRTFTRLRDKDGSEVRIFAPGLRSEKNNQEEQYHFYHRVHLRGSFNGYADSLKMVKNGNSRHIFLYRHAHLQNDSLYLEGDTIEILRDSIRETIRARRNAMMVMLPRNGRMNTLSAGNITLVRTDTVSEMQSENETESWFWNEEKGNTGLNHTKAPYQKAQIKGRKISRVSTKGVSSSEFVPAKKVNLDYMELCRKRISQRYQADSLRGNGEVPPLRHFLPAKNAPLELPVKKGGIPPQKTGIPGRKRN